MMREFKLRIELGDDAMQTRKDVASVLRDLASCLERGGEEGSVRDTNGNRVGEWSFDEETEFEE